MGLRNNKGRGPLREEPIEERTWEDAVLDLFRIPLQLLVYVVGMLVMASILWLTFWGVVLWAVGGFLFPITLYMFTMREYGVSGQWKWEWFLLGACIQALWFYWLHWLLVRRGQKKSDGQTPRGRSLIDALIRWWNYVPPDPPPVIPKNRDTEHLWKT